MREGSTVMGKFLKSDLSIICFSGQKITTGFVEFYKLHLRKLISVN